MRVAVLGAARLGGLVAADSSPPCRGESAASGLARLVLVYTLDTRGHRLLAEAEPDGRRVRRPWPIGWPFVQHSLAVAELYVRLRELEARGTIRLLHFAAEPASWYRSAQGVLKPDAWTVYETASGKSTGGSKSIGQPKVCRRWSASCGSTSPLPRSGQVGPLGVTPRVLLTVPTACPSDGRKARDRQLACTCRQTH